MNSKITESFMNQLAENPVNGLARVENAYSTIDKEQFAAQIGTDLERRYAELVDEIGRDEIAEARIDNLPYLGGFKTQKLFRKHAMNHLLTKLSMHDQLMDLHIGNGDRMICAPYDYDHAEGSAGILARLDGKSFFMLSGKGSSWAGVGFVLTTDQPILARVTPQGTFKWGYTSFEDMWSSSTVGGLGMHVIEDSNPIPNVSKRAELWSQFGLRKMEGHSGGGQIAQAKSPSLTPMGTLPLAPLSFNMFPGHRYVVWVYCWETSHVEKQAAFIGSLSFHMPCVAIHAGPQINPPH